MFDKEDVMPKPLYIPVNKNENHWIPLIVFPEPKLVVSYEPLKTDFKRKVLELEVLACGSFFSPHQYLPQYAKQNIATI